MILLLVGTGLYLTIRLRGLQFRTLLPSLYYALVVRREEGEGGEGDISHFEALMTALAATVGTGNIAGVATALVMGGPGALFWMWVTGLVGMATKYAEAVLAVRYRETDERGQMCGGPMYYISKGMNAPLLGAAFALFAAVAAFGVGNMVQSNSIAEAFASSFGVPYPVTGVILCVITGLVVIGGIQSIGRVTSLLVPVMILFYCLSALTILALNLGALPGILLDVVRQAFSPAAVAGGAAGSALLLTIRAGVSRGIFSNESGLGSSPIAAAAAVTSSPVRQALVSMTQTFIDTLVVCTMTGLVILSSGLLHTTSLNSSALTARAFELGLPGGLGGCVVCVGLALFAYSTILGWCYYGEKSIEYLLGEKWIGPYRVVFTAMVLIGAVAKLELVWTVADTLNGMMALPNLIALLALAGVVVEETDRYLQRRSGRGIF